MADGVTVAEAAAILGVSVDVVRKRLQRGTLAGEKQGRTWLVTLRQDTDRTPTGRDRTCSTNC
jgi:excisionase family DNA binding protein